MITLADIESIKGTAGNFTLKLKKRARFIDEEKCTGCGLCVANCPVHNIIYVTPEKDEIEISDEHVRIMDKIFAEYKETEGALVPILQKANDTFNYLPEPVLRYTADKLNMPLSVVCRIATFYKSFSLEPRGKHIISVCLGTACHVKGAGRVTAALESELGIRRGETTKDMKFTLETVRCIGCCGLAPVLKVGEDVHGLMSKTMVPELLHSYDGAS